MSKSERKFNEKKMEETVEKRGQFSFLTQYKDHKNTNNRKKIKVFKEAERVVIEILRLSTQKYINHLTLNV